MSAMLRIYHPSLHFVIYKSILLCIREDFSRSWANWARFWRKIEYTQKEGWGQEYHSQSECLRQRHKGKKRHYILKLNFKWFDLPGILSSNREMERDNIEGEKKISFLPPPFFSLLLLSIIFWRLTSAHTNASLKSESALIFIVKGEWSPLRSLLMQLLLIFFYFSTLLLFHLKVIYM